MQVAEGMLAAVGAPATEGTPTRAKTTATGGLKELRRNNVGNSRGNRTLSIKRPLKM